MAFWRITGVASIALALAATAVSAEVVAPSKVVIKDAELAQSLTGKAGDAAAGKKWFANRKLGNCLACHVNSEMKDEQFHGETGPSLDGVASRYEEPALRAILVDSKQVFGEQTLMPAFYKDSGYNRPRKQFAGKSILEAQQVEDVLAYLLTLKDAE